MAKKVYGWTRDSLDFRDHYYGASALVKDLTLPEVLDLREACPPVRNQGALGSCTAQAVAGALHFTMLEDGVGVFAPAELYIYYNTRVLQGTVKQDSGASIRTAVKSVVKEGYCHDELCPYVIKDFKNKPSREAYRDGEKRKLKSIHYQRVRQDLTELKQALVDNNIIVYGFAVYSSFETQAVAKSGVVPLPKRSEDKLGGHAVCLVGYDNQMSCFIVRNSWGSRWGDKGYFYMPYDYILNSDLASDFWVLKGVPRV